MEEKIILWSTGCPKCKVLIKKLEQKGYNPGIDYILEENNDKITAEATKRNSFSVPFITEGEKLYDFASANKFIAALKAK